jgi:hypothetical protein
MSVRGRFVTSVYLDDMVIAHGSELPRKAESIYSALCAACEQLDIYDPIDNAVCDVASVDGCRGKFCRDGR